MEAPSASCNSRNWTEAINYERLLLAEIGHDLPLNSSTELQEKDDLSHSRPISRMTASVGVGLTSFQNSV